MHEIETIAMGEGWSIIRDMGELKLTIRGNFTARATCRGGYATVNLPDSFAVDLFRQKREIRAAFAKEEK
jgi:hypothetical protein